MVDVFEIGDFVSDGIYLSDKSREYINGLESLRNNQVEDELIEKDPSTEKIKQLINYVAKMDATVLITGETGVGKEVVAKEIYIKIIEMLDHILRLIVRLFQKIYLNPRNVWI